MISYVNIALRGKEYYRHRGTAINLASGCMFNKQCSPHTSADLAARKMPAKHIIDSKLLVSVY